MGIGENRTHLQDGLSVRRPPVSPRRKADRRHFALANTSGSAANWALHRGFPCPSDLADLFATLASSRNSGVSQTCSKDRKMGMTAWRQFKLRSTRETAWQSSLCCRENVSRCVSFAPKMTSCFSVNLCVSIRSNRETGPSSGTCSAISAEKTRLNIFLARY